MTDSFKLLAGNKEGMPNLPDRAPAFVRDEQAIYVGTPDGNLMLCKAKNLRDIEALEESVKSLGEADTAMQQSIQQLNEAVGKKLSASPAAAQAELGADANLAAVIASINQLIADMKAAGLMNT